jgi:hypothetical protein
LQALGAGKPVLLILSARILAYGSREVLRDPGAKNINSYWRQGSIPA